MNRELAEILFNEAQGCSFHRETETATEQLEAEPVFRTREDCPASLCHQKGHFCANARQIRTMRKIRPVGEMGSRKKGSDRVESGTRNHL